MRTPLVWLLVALVVATYAITLNRFPIQFGDGPFYASIARSLELGRPGIPSLLKQGPTAVDHVRFYGPVYFSTLAAWFMVAGFSSTAFRVFCLASAIFAVAGAVALSWALGGGPKRPPVLCPLHERTYHRRTVQYLAAGDPATQANAC